jgi:hypothetical protein
MNTERLLDLPTRSYHEASHALCSLSLRMTLRKMTVEVTEEYHGRCSTSMTGFRSFDEGREIEEFLQDESIPVAEREVEARRWREAKLAILLAGPVGAYRWHRLGGRKHSELTVLNSEWGCLPECWMVGREIARRVGIAQLRPAYLRLWRWLRELLTDQWQVVGVFAAAVAAHETLEATDIQALIAQVGGIPRRSMPPICRCSWLGPGAMTDDVQQHPDFLGDVVERINPPDAL